MVSTWCAYAEAKKISVLFKTHFFLASELGTTEKLRTAQVSVLNEIRDKHQTFSSGVSKVVFQRGPNVIM